MANLIRTSCYSLSIIPVESRYTLHRMYEDSDSDGADDAEQLVDFLESQTPGVYVAVQGNDSVGNTCHYPCDYYDPYWHIILIPAKVWEEHKDEVKRLDQEWQDSHGCKMKGEVNA